MLPLLILAAMPAKSGPIQITADGRWLWAANEHHDSVARIDTATREVREIELGECAPRGLAVREDGSEIWIACHGSDRIDVIDRDGALLQRIDLPFGSGPVSVAISPDQRTVLAALHRSGQIAVIEEKRATELMPVFMSPLGIVWLPDRSAWIAHLFTDEEHPRITRIDLAGAPRVTSRIIATAGEPRLSSRLAPPYDVAEGGHLFFRGHPAQVPGGDRIWIPTEYHHITEDRFTPDSTIQATIRQLDPIARSLPSAEAIVLTAVHVHDPAGQNPYVGPGWNAGIAGPIDIGFDGSIAYVVNEQSCDLIAVPLNTPAHRPEGSPPLLEIPVGDQPIGIAVSPVAHTAYVLNLLSRDVSEIDLAAGREIARIPTTPSTKEPFTSSLLIGAKLFHGSSDERMSKNGKVACASCHFRGEHETRVWQFQHLPGLHGPRQSVSLLGIRATLGGADPKLPYGQIDRSGDRDELQDFEHTITGPLMGGRGFLGKRVRPELGAPNAGLDPNLDALAEYVLSLPPLERSPYRRSDGALTDAAIRGAVLFVRSGCAECHVPETGFCDRKFHDVGSRRPESEKELADRGWTVNTPTLIGVWTSPPYEGAPVFAGTILELLLAHGKTDGLTDRELADLAQLVLSIDGNTTAKEIREAKDVSPPEVIRAEPVSTSRIAVWFDEAIDRGGGWSIEGTVVEAVEYSDRSGDRVDLIAKLSPHTRYRIVPSGIRDLAGNAIVPEDNTKEIEIGDTLTVTLGASAKEHIRIRVHDASMVGPDLPDWAHDKVWVGMRENERTYGFVRFDWREAFTRATGIQEADRIESVSFSLSPHDGEATTYEARRVLRRWADPELGGAFQGSPPTNGNYFTDPIGAPTWNASAHRTLRWKSKGAASLGSDLGAEIDATATLRSLDERVSFSGARITDAYRFWFDHPKRDSGHAIRLSEPRSRDGAGVPSRQEEFTKFHAAEEPFGEAGPVLAIVYRVEQPGRSAALWIAAAIAAITVVLIWRRLRIS